MFVSDYTKAERRDAGNNDPAQCLDYVIRRYNSVVYSHIGVSRGAVMSLLTICVHNYCTYSFIYYIHIAFIYSISCNTVQPHTGVLDIKVVWFTE